jgi:hypothetical protein
MENRRGFPWRQRSSFEATSPVMICGGWPDPAGTRSRFGGSRFGGCWRWRRSAMAEPGRRRRGLAGSGCRSCGTGWYGFNAEGPDGLIDRKAPGKAPTLTPAQRAALAGAVEVGPEPWRDGVVRWRLIDLVQWLWDEFRVSVSEATVGRELRALGFRKLSARPRHYAQDPEAAEAFKTVSRSAWRRSAPRIPASA